MVTVKVKYRETGYYPKMNIIEVGDVPGHLMMLGEQSSVISYDDGSFAVTSSKFIVDVTNGVGKIEGYWLGTFEDGSTQWTKYQGTAVVDPDGKTGRYEGTNEFIKGTGRFEGIQGSGSWTTKRLAPAPGAGNLCLNDGTATYTLPSK